MLEPRWLALPPLDSLLLSPVDHRSQSAAFPKNQKIGNLRRAFRPFPIVLLKPTHREDVSEDEGTKPVIAGAAGGEREKGREMMRGDIEHVRELQVSLPCHLVTFEVDSSALDRWSMRISVATGL